MTTTPDNNTNTTTSVINIRHDPSQLQQPNTVRIDRRTKWGNPFVIGLDGDRAEVIQKYRKMLHDKRLAGTLAIDELANLKGKQLACWCKPAACHGDVLASAAEWAHRKINEQQSTKPLPTTTTPASLSHEAELSQ